MALLKAEEALKQSQTNKRFREDNAHKRLMQKASYCIENAVDMGELSCEFDVDAEDRCAVEIVMDELKRLGYKVATDLGLNMNVQWYK